MDKLPTTVIEEILWYLDALDRHNLMKVLQIVETDMYTRLISHMNLAFNSRFTKALLRPLISHKKHIINHLDLTGIFWIAPSAFKIMILQLVNIEVLYLLGTKVMYKELSGLHDYLKLKKLQYLTIRKYSPVFLAVLQVLKRKGETFQVIAEFQPRQYSVFPNTRGLPINNSEWLSILNNCRSEHHFHALAASYKERCKKMTYQMCDNIAHGEARNMDLTTKILYIHKHEKISNHGTFTFNALKDNPNATHLYVDVEFPFNTTFLQLIFRSGRNLESLAVTLNFPTLLTNFFKEAPPSLKCLSIFGGSLLNLNLPQLLYEIKGAPQLELRRMLLAIAETDCNKQALDVFLSSNPQLDFFVIASDWSLRKHRDVQALMNSHISRSSQYFYSWPRHCLRTELKNIPLMYLDMVCYISCAEYILTP